ncbi:unnamed protein product [Heligmosomoides polygyrus]|uniref:ANF_receptor domain-containing protein n=1 Tax=Heligmosomoides polygyrus TaxID=6339 RepID=A0A183GIC4_HELPZ|nr:unnamed protein product [Heligmosomoides polygyrus]
MKRVSLLGMVSDEYVYVLLGTRGFGFGQLTAGEAERVDAQPIATLSNGMTPFWEDLQNNHADDAIVKDAAKRMLTVDINSDDVDPIILKQFTDNVVPRIRRDPLYCSTQACMSNEGKAMATWSRHLHDVFYLYGLSLSSSLALDPINGLSNAITLSQAMKRSFKGLTGLVTINENGTRVPLYSVYGLDSSYDQTDYLNFTITDGYVVLSKGYTDEYAIWQSRGGKRPLSVPACGFMGENCPKGFWEEYTTYVAVGGAVIGIFLIAVVTFVIYVTSLKISATFYRIRQEQIERNRLLWQIPHSKLRKPANMRELQQQSKRSLQSGPSVMTGDSRFTSETDFGSYEIYFLEKDAVLTAKYPVTGLTRNDYLKFPQV